MIEVREALQARIESKIEPDTNGGCWLWTGSTDKNGYGILAVNRRATKAHRASYGAYNGEVPNGLCVCHSCDVRSCVNPKHLWIGTKSDNSRDMISKGRGAVQNPLQIASFKERGSYRLGSNNPRSVLNEEIVAKIKRRLLDGESLSFIASATGVKYGTIYAIKMGKTWREVEAKK